MKKSIFFVKNKSHLCVLRASARNQDIKIPMQVDFSGDLSSAIFQVINALTITTPSNPPLA